eukprot:Hpha_TRINITY_DN9497_c1_g1::TRINITY_DN9497_c1_g1_i1::g.139239::m.139239
MVPSAPSPPRTFFLPHLPLPTFPSFLSPPAHSPCGGGAGLPFFLLSLFPLLFAIRTQPSASYDSFPDDLLPACRLGRTHVLLRPPVIHVTTTGLEPVLTSDVDKQMVHSAKAAGEPEANGGRLHLLHPVSFRLVDQDEVRIAVRDQRHLRGRQLRRPRRLRNIVHRDPLHLRQALAHPLGERRVLLPANHMNLPARREEVYSPEEGLRHGETHNVQTAPLGGLPLRVGGPRVTRCAGRNGAGGGLEEVRLLMNGLRGRLVASIHLRNGLGLLGVQLLLRGLPELLLLRRLGRRLLELLRALVLLLLGLLRGLLLRVLTGLLLLGERRVLGLLLVVLGWHSVLRLLLRDLLLLRLLLLHPTHHRIGVISLQQHHLFLTSVLRRPRGDHIDPVTGEPSVLHPEQQNASTHTTEGLSQGEQLDVIGGHCALLHCIDVGREVRREGVNVRKGIPKVGRAAGAGSVRGDHAMVILNLGQPRRTGKVDSARRHRVAVDQNLVPHLRAALPPPSLLDHVLARLLVEFRPTAHDLSHPTTVKHQAIIRVRVPHPDQERVQQTVLPPPRHPHHLQPIRRRPPVDLRPERGAGRGAGGAGGGRGPGAGGGVLGRVARLGCQLGLGLRLRLLQLGLGLGLLLLLLINRRSRPHTDIVLHSFLKK